MSDETNVAPGGSEDASASAVITPANLNGDSYTPEQAFAAYEKRNSPAESADEPATAETQSADEADAAPETDPGEDTKEAEPAEQPPIEPPRSWTKEDKEEFATYPREAQEKIAKAATRYESEFRRSQNEIAETRKAVEAEREVTAKHRQEYEAKLPAIMQALQDAQAGAFSDVKNMDDVTRLASEDPFRYLQWQAHQQKMQAVNYEMEQTKARQTDEQKASWTSFVQKENAKAAELHPELADPKQAEKLQKSAVSLLEEKGFTPQELNRLASGEEKLSVFDHRIQSLLLDGVKFREAKSAPPKALAKPVPSVQKPGVARAPGANSSDAIKASRNKLSGSGSVDDAFDLYMAKQRARA